MTETEQWTNILEGGELDIQVEPNDHAPTTVEIETPVGFSQSDYSAMADELWSEGAYQTRTALEESMEWATTSARVLGESVYGAAEDIFDGKRPEDKRIFGVLASGCAATAAAMSPMIHIAQSGRAELMKPMHKEHDTVFDVNHEMNPRVAEVFYTESDNERYVSVARGQGRKLDPDVVGDVVEYMEDF